MVVRRHLLLFLASFFIMTPFLAGKAQGLDSESIECLSCHDAALATDTDIITVCPEPDCNHPIGTDYIYSSSTNHGLKPAYMLDPAIKLVNGNNIGCGTCHVSYSSLNHALLSSLRSQYPASPDPMLTVDNRISGLCFGCHDK